MNFILLFVLKKLANKTIKLLANRTCGKHAQKARAVSTCSKHVMSYVHAVVLP